MTTIITERPLDCTLTIYHGEDWYDPVPQLVDPRDGTPVDVTDILFELFCRPSLDHATRFLLATSAGSAGIIKEDATNGLIAFFKPQAEIEAALPTSSRSGWRQFLRMTANDVILGDVSKHVWLGPLIVIPARDAPTA